MNVIGLRGLAACHRNVAGELFRDQTPALAGWQPRSLADWRAAIPDRGAALRAAHIESGIPISEQARELRLSVGRVSQLIKEAEPTKEDL